MPTIWYSSDHHFWHANVIRYCNRPFNSVVEMNEALVAKWNAAVKPEDTVYYLGDFSLAFRSVELYTRRLNGEKILIAGNHDFCHPYNKKSRKPDHLDEWVRKYKECGWGDVRQEDSLLLLHRKERTIHTPVRLCHLPYAGSADPGYEGHDKFEKYRLEDTGSVLLCGHVHEKWAERKTARGTLMINVGVDVRNYAPISEDEVRSIIDKNL